MTTLIALGLLSFHTFSNDRCNSSVFIVFFVSSVKREFQIFRVLFDLFIKLYKFLSRIFMANIKKCLYIKIGRFRIKHLK